MFSLWQTRHVYFIVIWIIILWQIYNVTYQLFGHYQNGIQDKAVKNKPLRPRQLARNSAISTVRFVVERTLGSQQRWFGGKTLRYQGLAKAHAWHVLLAVAYNLKRLLRLYVESPLPRLPQAKPA
ncbi:transposase [Methyloglobulus morosus]|uniref:transposase n=1 Tax=Methyloglobulus morosus TaxID=1410681 RepID=UPI00128F7EC1|nr:transposase [Methyloglobulus morosus]